MINRETKRRRMSVLTLGLGVVLALGCGDNGTEPDGISAADFAGSWEVTSFVVTSHDDPNLSSDLIAGGAAIHVAVQPSGSFSGAAVIPGELVSIPEIGVVTVPLAGVVRVVDQETLVVEFVPQIPPVFTTWNAEFTLIGDVLTAVDTDAEFDFGDDSTWDRAIFQTTMVRN